jgi:hypothetical protein
METSNYRVYAGERGILAGAVARVILAIGVGTASAAALMVAAERAAQASAIWWVSQTNRRML